MINVNSIARSIIKTQKLSGDIPWHDNGKTDPWDHVESAMGLTIAGAFKEAMMAFDWIKNLQMEDGSWYSSYIEGVPYDMTRETHMSAYIAVGVFHYWLITNNYDFLNLMWNTVRKSIDFAIQYQGINGEIYWAISPKGDVDTTALLTASSSVYMSLKCALAIAQELKIEMPYWRKALKKLKRAIRGHSNSIFDSSKDRFSMNWFYPILCGAISGDSARNRINKYWNKFVVDDLGVRCVSDQPWITIAESSELILSLSAIDNMSSANSLFKCISNRVFKDGSFWCGFTFPDIKLWPINKMSWTNAVVLIVLDVLYGLTPAKNIFHHSWWKKKYGIV